MSKAPAVDYALDIIEFFADFNEEVGIADISNALNINKNAVSRVLEALLEKNWIYMSDSSQKKYSLTLRPFSLIARHTQEDQLIKISTPVLKRLNKELGDSVYLGVKNGQKVLYLAHCDSTKDVRINGCAGGEYPMNCSAPGKILLSHSDESEILRFFDLPVEKRTDNTIVTAKDFKKEAEKIRENGYAVDNEEFAKGIICISVPIFDSTDKIIASIGISTLTLYDDIDGLINNKLNLLKEAGNEISCCLGGKKQI